MVGVIARRAVDVHVLASANALGGAGALGALVLPLDGSAEEAGPARVRLRYEDVVRGVLVAEPAARLTSGWSGSRWPRHRERRLAPGHLVERPIRWALGPVAGLARRSSKRLPMVLGRGLVHATLLAAEGRVSTRTGIGSPVLATDWTVGPGFAIGATGPWLLATTAGPDLTIARWCPCLGVALVLWYRACLRCQRLVVDVDGLAIWSVTDGCRGFAVGCGGVGRRGRLIRGRSRRLDGHQAWLGRCAGRGSRSRRLVEVWRCLMRRRCWLIARPL